MGKGSGVGGLIAVIGLVFLLGSRKKGLTASSFNLSGPGPSGPWPYTSRDYIGWATDMDAPVEELETSPSTGKTWRTVSRGRIPTPEGGSIPIPVKWPGGTVNVNEMLKDVEEEAPAMEQEPGGPISVNVHLRPVG